MRWMPLAKLSNLPPGKCINVFVEHVGVALANVEGQVYAMDNRCPHKGGPLGMGEMDGEWILCPYHDWAFSMTTGEWDNDRERHVTRLPVRIEGDDIIVEMPDPGEELPDPKYTVHGHTKAVRKGHCC